MAFDLKSGTGGKIVITSASSAELAVGTYTVTRTNKHDDVTGSHTAGWETFKTVVRGGSITGEIFWDASKTPEDCALDEGDEVTADLHIGSSGKKYAGVKLLMESLALVGCSQDAVVHYTFNAKINALPADPVAV